MKPIHQRLNLYTVGDEAYVFAPTGEPVAAQSLTVHRATGEVVLNPPQTPIPQHASRSGKSVHGILGMISLALSEYIVIITGREPKGRLCGQDIFRASDFDILPLNPNANVLNPPHPVEGYFLALLRSHLQSGSFLFSYGWDLTRRLQAQWESQNLDSSKGVWEVADDRFFWNKYLQTRFIESSEKQDLSSFILPVIYGTFDVRPIFIHGRHMHLALISRRSRYRAGTRYFRRGIDHEGHVANFNESEQLLFVEHPNTSGAVRVDDQFAHQFSFVQIRGSVPFFWAEVNTVRYKPDLQVMELPDTPDAMKLHLLEQVSTYGPQTLVNLVNHKGHEKPVKDGYERWVGQLGLTDVRYQYFDFHTECKNMRWDRISLLVDKLQLDLQKQGYFHIDSSDPKSNKLQNGTVRTNCMDNLDRTNVVQATLAKYALNRQLREIGVLTKEQGVDDFEALSKDFREMWADHADAISKAYAGSGALKSDFTRTNERTRKGLLEDGVKSILRYLKNNFLDGARQDAFDLFTGAWIPRRNPSSMNFLITDPRPLVIRSAPAIASFSLFMICAGLTLPRSSDYSLVYYFFLWIMLLLASTIFMVTYGIDYVSWPKLIPLDSVIYYEGPGYRSAKHGMGLKGMNVKLGLDNGAKWLKNKRKVGMEAEGIPMVHKRVD
ncbi:SacI homology domain-containing protein [Lentinula aciculospora]|uniref:SacI homology domain-containing protein n=1 Tax=Lentinula aciculospora TaxID=153920 RepID=A0A9W9A8Z1_9AGAR|nr:SacI homology domain-containing protein [Lentinula aciculospora]